MAKVTYTRHPCITIDSTGRPYLNLMSGIFHENSLPKWQVIRRAKKEKPIISAVGTGTEDATDISETLGRLEAATAEDGFSSEQGLHGRSTHNTYEYDRLMAASYRDRKAHKPNLWERLLTRRGTPVEETMEEMKSSLRVPNTTEEIEKAAKSAKTLLAVLEKSGQLGQAAKLRDYIRVLTYEITLSKAGYQKYLLEEDVIKFMLKAEKGVYIDFLRNYKDILPIEVAEKKIEADKLMVFDNYAVLFYSPDVDPFREIIQREEERRRRDPILFGLIEGSKKLYYITDWVFKDDDLTLEKLEEVIGQKARPVNEIQVAGDITITRLNENLVSYERLLANGSNEEEK